MTARQSAFVEEVPGRAFYGLRVEADEMLATVGVVGPHGDRGQAQLDRAGLRRLIEALETAEKHLTYNHQHEEARP